MMPDEILHNLYRIQIPLPDSPLKYLNSYVIKSSKRNLIIDTGWNQQECMDSMHTGLRKLGVDLNRSDFFITHMHTDHLGLVPNLIADTSVIYFNQPDANSIKSDKRRKNMIHFAILNGFPEREIQKVFKSRPRYNVDFVILKEGDTISIGEYLFKVVETPGHTKGHTCLYEPTKKILVSGDHILNDITPNITLWSEDRNPLKEYLTSLDKVYKSDIELVLPGHRNIFRNCKERIQELKQHHQKRNEEIVSVLKNSSKNAFQVASEMSWDITYESWSLFPVRQKWFATGEAIAHLKYLEEEGVILKKAKDRKINYAAC